MTDTTYPTDTIQDSERPKGWRDLYPPHPAAELFPLMTAEELGGLTADIERHGLREPITLHDEGGQCWVLDGRNRMDALALLGKGLSEDGYGGCHFEYPGLHDPSFDPFTFVVSRNLHRRHLTVEQRKEVAAKLLAINPAQSNRQVAKATGIDHKTVATVRAAGEATGEIPQLDKTVGADSKARTTVPTRKARRTADDFIANRKAQAMALADRAEKQVQASAQPASIPRQLDIEHVLPDADRLVLEILERDQIAPGYAKAVMVGIAARLEVSGYPDMPDVLRREPTIAPDAST